MDRATCLIVDGDVASLLPSKTQGDLSCFKLGSSCSWVLSSYFIFGGEACVLFVIMFCTSVGFAGAFLKMFLGPVNLRATRKEVQLKVKEEYNSYRVCVKLYYYSWYSWCQVVFSK